MTLNEQWLKKHKRIYYHGFEKNYDDTLRNFKNEFYLTTKIDYAISYAQRGGKITSYVLNENVNIFNMRDKYDEGNFRKYCQKNMPQNLKYIDFLKDNDWASPKIGGDFKRQVFIDAIRNLGYDGYFNFEIDEDGLEYIHRLGLYKHIDRDLRSPSIALFNTDFITEIETVPVESLVDKNKEIEYVKDIAASKKLDMTFNEDYFVKRILQSTLSLTEDEIIDIADNITSEDLKESLRKDVCVIKALAQHEMDWNYEVSDRTKKALEKAQKRYENYDGKLFDRILKEGKHNNDIK